MPIVSARRRAHAYPLTLARLIRCLFTEQLEPGRYHAVRGGSRG